MSCPFARVASALGIQPGSEEAKAAFASSPFHSGHAAGKASSPSSLSTLKALAAFSGVSAPLQDGAVQEKQDRPRSTSSSTLLSPLSAPLSQHLATGTASAHRQVERSAGVKALMASLSKGGNKELAMGRLDYVRWLIMIDAVYLVMESELLTLQSAVSSVSSTTSATPTMLKPFLSHATLLPTLLRTSTIEADIQAHVTALEEETNISLADHVEAASLENDDASSSSSQEKVELKQIVARYRGAEERDNNARIDLLSRRQVSATLAYIKHIQSLASLPLVSTSSSASSKAGPAALFSHAYTRYMGDLSGGQFIKKHIEAKWPCLSDEQGFSFYDFNSSAFTTTSLAGGGNSLAAKLANEKALKDAFRSSMDEGFELAAEAEGGGDERRRILAEEMVAEGVVAFELNGDLFDALIDSSVQTFNRDSDEKLQAAQMLSSKGKGLSGLSTLLPILLVLLASILLVMLSDSPSSTASPLPPSLRRLNTTAKAGLRPGCWPAAAVEAFARLADFTKIAS